MVNVGIDKKSGSGTPTQPYDGYVTLSVPANDVGDTLVHNFKINCPKIGKTLTFHLLQDSYPVTVRYEIKDYDHNSNKVDEHGKSIRVLISATTEWELSHEGSGVATRGTEVSEIEGEVSGKSEFGDFVVVGPEPGDGDGNGGGTDPIPGGYDWKLFDHSVFTTENMRLVANSPAGSVVTEVFKQEDGFNTIGYGGGGIPVSHAQVKIEFPFTTVAGLQTFFVDYNDDLFTKNAVKTASNYADVAPVGSMEQTLSITRPHDSMFVFCTKKEYFDKVKFYYK